MLLSWAKAWCIEERWRRRLRVATALTSLAAGFESGRQRSLSMAESALASSLLCTAADAVSCCRKGEGWVLKTPSAKRSAALSTFWSLLGVPVALPYRCQTTHA